MEKTKAIRSTLHAFTLVELLVVLVLVSIVAVIAAPRFVTTPNFEAQAQRMLSDIRYTQMLAITHDQRYLVSFTLPNTYTITDTSGTIIPNPSTGNNTVTLPSGMTISSLTNLPKNLIAFDEKGIPYTDSTTSTTLASTASVNLSMNGVSRQISITQQTGSTALQ